MLRSYRSIVVAVGLVLAGAAPPQKQAVSTQPAQKIAPAPSPTTDYAPYPNYKPDPCYQAKDHEAADLCAQLRAAIAAEKSANFSEWSAWIAGAGAILSFVGIILVVLALRQTEKSLKEARNANAIARHAHERELRAYLMAEDHEIVGFWRDGPTTMRLKLYNRGQTPAHDVCIWSVVTGTLSDPTGTKIFKPINVFQQSSDVIGPGNFSVHENGCQSPLDGNAYLGIVNGELKMIFAGIVTYRDAFRRRRFTTFKQLYVGDGNFATIAGDLTACGRGNIAT